MAAEIVETELPIASERRLRRIPLATVPAALRRRDPSGAYAQKVKDWEEASFPSSRQLIVDGRQVHLLAANHAQVRGDRRDVTRTAAIEVDDPPTMNRQSSDQLGIGKAASGSPANSFTAGSQRCRNNSLRRGRRARPQVSPQCPQAVVGQRCHPWLVAARQCHEPVRLRMVFQCGHKRVVAS